MNKILESIGVEAALRHEAENLDDMEHETNLTVLQQRCKRVRHSLILIANRISKTAESAPSASTSEQAPINTLTSTEQCQGE